MNFQGDDMTIRIEANGSKFSGEPPDSLEALHERLRQFPLDPKFERYGNFVCERGPDAVELWGNFYSISAVFRLFGSRDELALTIELIRQNQERPDYRGARALVATVGNEAGAFAAPAGELPGDGRSVDPTATHCTPHGAEGDADDAGDHIPDEVHSDPELWFDICNDPAIWPENRAAAYRAALRGERNWRFAFVEDLESAEATDSKPAGRNWRPPYLRRVK
jgi:hypothetical protein